MSPTRRNSNGAAWITMMTPMVCLILHTANVCEAWVPNTWSTFLPSSSSSLNIGSVDTSRALFPPAGMASARGGKDTRFAAAATTTSTSLSMGMFDFIEKAFSNEDFDDRRVTASHILVDDIDEISVVQNEIANGVKFEDAARLYSKCPSGESKGGSLGTFEPKSMVKEFDDVVFGDPEASPIGEIVGPIKTQFGYHLIRVDERFDNTIKSDGNPFF